MNNFLYGHLDPSLKTLFIRLTGDNFRASSKYPTEQLSYSFLNNSELLHSPYGQFIASLFRGSESRENLNIHGKAHYAEVKDLLINGYNFNGEKFNVVPFLCADLSFVKEILGKCSSMVVFSARCILMIWAMTVLMRQVSKSKGEWRRKKKSTIGTIGEIIFAGLNFTFVLKFG